MCKVNKFLFHPQCISVENHIHKPLKHRYSAICFSPDYDYTSLDTQSANFFRYIYKIILNAVFNTFHTLINRCQHPFFLCFRHKKRPVTISVMGRFSYLNFDFDGGVVGGYLNTQVMVPEDPGLPSSTENRHSRERCTHALRIAWSPAICARAARGTVRCRHYISV